MLCKYVHALFTSLIQLYTGCEAVLSCISTPIVSPYPAGVSIGSPYTTHPTWAAIIRHHPPRPGPSVEAVHRGTRRCCGNFSASFSAIPNAPKTRCTSARMGTLGDSGCNAGGLWGTDSPGMGHPRASDTSRTQRQTTTNGPKQMGHIGEIQLDPEQFRLVDWSSWLKAEADLGIINRQLGHRLRLGFIV